MNSKFNSTQTSLVLPITTHRMLLFGSPEFDKFRKQSIKQDLKPTSSVRNKVSCSPSKWLAFAFCTGCSEMLVFVSTLGISSGGFIYLQSATTKTTLKTNRVVRGAACRQPTYEQSTPLRSRRVSIECQSAFVVL